MMQVDDKVGGNFAKGANSILPFDVPPNVTVVVRSDNSIIKNVFA